MLRLTICPKCTKGDVTLDRDYYGWYEYCLQCGYMHDLRSTVNLGQRQSSSGEEKEKRVTVLSKG